MLKIKIFNAVIGALFQPGEVGVGGGAGELVVEERAVDLAEDELVAHGAVGHHAEGVVDDAAVAAPGQLRRWSACKIDKITISGLLG